MSPPRYKREFWEFKLLVRKEFRDEFLAAWDALRKAAAEGKSVSAEVARGIAWAVKIDGAFKGLDEKDHDVISGTLIPMYSHETISRFIKLRGYDFEGAPKVAGKYQGGCSFRRMVSGTYYHILAECTNDIDKDKDECLCTIYSFINTYLNEREITTKEYSDYRRWVVAAHVALTLGLKFSEYPRLITDDYFDCGKTARRMMEKRKPRQL